MIDKDKILEFLLQREFDRLIAENIIESTTNYNQWKAETFKQYRQSEISPYDLSGWKRTIKHKL